MQGIVISSLLLSVFVAVKSFTYNNPECAVTNGTQSPINIISGNSKYYDEKLFRILSNEYNVLGEKTMWKSLFQANALGFEPAQDESFGTVTVIKDWAIYQFNLTRVIFRAKAEHSIDNGQYDLEMQLEHTINNLYIPPGKRIDLGLKYMYISLLFKKTIKDDPQVGDFFYYTDIEGFSKGVNKTVLRDIRLKQIIQHMPLYMYEGSQTYPKCEKALWMISPKFHLITDLELGYFTSAMKSMKVYDEAARGNQRTFAAAFNNNVDVYRNFKDLNVMTQDLNYFRYDSSNFIRFSKVVMLLALAFLLFI